VRVSTWVWANSASFTHKKAGKDAYALRFSDAWSVCHMCQTHVSAAKTMCLAHGL